MRRDPGAIRHRHKKVQKYIKEIRGKIGDLILVLPNTDHRPPNTGIGQDLRDEPDLFNPKDTKDTKGNVLFWFVLLLNTDYCLPILVMDWILTLSLSTSDY
ncbi:MAG: hypothetical protein ABEJ65_00645 [bacterium]